MAVGVYAMLLSKAREVDSPFAFDDRGLRVAARFGLGRGGPLRAGRLAALLVALTWLPLLLLTLMEGTAYDGVSIPLLGDFLPHGRYLIALPLLVFLHPVVDRKIAAAIAALQASDLVAAADQATLQRLLDRVKALWRSPIARLSIVVVSVLAVFLVLPARSLIADSHWMFSTESDAGLLSPAGWWSLLVSSTLIRLLLLFALWKLILWSWFLWRLSRLPLNYQPLHPDRGGGIAFLDRVSIGFGTLAAALGIQLGCIIADAVTYRGQDVLSFSLPAAAFVALIVVMLFAPLLAFLRPLAAARGRTEAMLRAWVAPAARQVGASLQQTGSEAVASELSAQDLSSLNASAALFDGTVRMRWAPIGKKALISALAVTVLSACLPLLPLLPLKQIARGLLGIVL